MKTVKIYADGSCIGNPGPGGWAAVIAGADAGRQIEAKGCDWHTTNSRMEIRAALGGLTAAAAQEAPEKMDVTIYSDSQYVVKQIGTRKIEDFTMTGKYKNADLWAELFRLIPLFHSVRAEWIRGHSGHRLNEYVDRIARAEARQCVTEEDVRRFTFRQLLIDPRAQAAKVYHLSGCRYSMKTIKKYIDLYREKYGTRHS